ncbi:MAG TPA: acyl-CoA thioesterase [Pirellulaceae bacterium]
MPSKRVASSSVELHHFMMPEHANLLGNVHGGIIMKLVDEAAGLCAMRHAQRFAVTVAIDSMEFHEPVRVGDVLCLRARLNFVGRTSMEVGVQVTAENPITGQITHTNSALCVYVALDEHGKPVEVPGLELISEEERTRWGEAKTRQAHRLRSKK